VRAFGFQRFGCAPILWLISSGVPFAFLCLLAVMALARRAAAIDDIDAEETIAEFLPQPFPDHFEQRDISQRQWAVLPELGYGPDTSILAGVKFAHRNLFHNGTTLDLEGTYAFNQQELASVTLGSPHLFDDRVILLLHGKYYLDPQREFFGLGNNDAASDPTLPTSHEFQDASGMLTIGWRPWTRLALNFSIGARRVDIGRGERNDSHPFTITDPRFENLVGIHGGLVNHMALSAVWDTRDDLVRPTHGWRLIAKVAHAGHGLGSDFEFTRYVADVGYLRAFFRRRLVGGLRMDGAYIDGPKSELPFWELEELGGHDTMRGFFPHRFLGKARFLLNGELRFLLTEFDFYKLWHVQLDGVVFGDGGRVFFDNTDIRKELRGNVLQRVLSDFQYSYGGGLRIALSEALVARIDVGFSDEETGLVYLSFGQTF